MMRSTPSAECRSSKCAPSASKPAERSVMTARERLVVIGNGMAGARLIEDLINRGARDRFDITVFGDEACGNYNRILLSSVLSRSHKPEDIFINPASWYA